MIRLLQELLEWASQQNDLVAVNTLERLVEDVNNKELTKDDLPIPLLYKEITRSVNNQNAANSLLVYFLMLLDNYESRKMRRELHFEVLRRHELLSRMDAEKREAIRQNDAIALLQLRRDIDLLNQAPKKTRQIDPETIEIALKALRLKELHKNWTYNRISTEIYGDPSHADQIKKAVSRARKAGKLSS